MADFGMSTISDIKEAALGEGLGVAGGFILAGAIGRLVQNKWVTDTDVAADPSLATMAKAWAGNNVPKLIAWHFGRPYATSELTTDARKAFMGSVVFDTIMRAANKGQNPATASIGNTEVLGNGSDGIRANIPADVQHLIQENEALRREINKMQRQAGLEAPYAMPDGAEARRRKYGAMDDESTLQTPRQKKYAFMGLKADAEFAGAVPDLAGKFGML